MTPPWIRKSAKLTAAFLASLLVNLPVVAFKDGPSAAVQSTFLLAFMFTPIVIGEFFRQAGKFPKFFADRSFDDMVLRTFLLTIPLFLINLLSEMLPKMFWGGLPWGFVVGLITYAPYATIDDPQTSNTRYWTKFGLLIGVAAGTATYLLGGRSTASLIHGFGVTLAYVIGLWLGLTLGHSVNKWIAALEPTFRLLRRMATTLLAFAAGYLAIVILFATFYAALWRLEGAASFVGLPSTPHLPTFVYFSLVTAATIGFGDIVPKSSFARSLTGLESVLALGWTLVVFAALSVRFAEAVSAESTRREGSD